MYVQSEYIFTKNKEVPRWGNRERIRSEEEATVAMMKFTVSMKREKVRSWWRERETLEREDFCVYRKEEVLGEEVAAKTQFLGFKRQPIYFYLFIYLYAIKTKLIRCTFLRLFHLSENGDSSSSTGLHKYKDLFIFLFFFHFVFFFYFSVIFFSLAFDFSQFFNSCCGLWPLY